MGLFSTLRSFFTPSPTSSDVVNDGEGYWWGGNSWGVSSTHAGEAVDQDSLMTSATCYACTKALAETAAGLPSTIYRTSQEMKVEDRNQSAYELLSEQPNPEMDSFTFFDLLVTRLVNRGNFFAEIQRDGQDRPIALWPIHNSRVQPMRDTGDGSLYWEVTSDFAGTPNYSDPTWRKAHLSYLSSHNMLNVVGFGSQNGVMAPGMLPAAQEIGLDFATRRYGGGFFSKGARPSGVVEHPGFIPDEGKRNIFRKDLNQIHSNQQNAHGIGVLWQGATYKAVSIPPEQAQFLETRKFTAQQLCKFYGVPPAIIGDYEDSKFATADAMIRAFVMLTLRNLVVRVERSINRQVLNVRGSDGRLKRAFSKPIIYEMAIDGLLRGDPKAQAETHSVYRSLGVLSTDEIREQIGYNPTQHVGGDYLIVNGGMSRLDKIDEQGTRPGNDSQASGNPADNDDDDSGNDAKLPKFDRVAMAEMIANSGLVQPAAQVRGADLPEPQPPAEDPLIGAIVELSVDAVARIHKIAESQVNRWREQDPAEVAAKLPGFWAKQESRLLDALAASDKLAMRVRFSAQSNISSAVTAMYLTRYAELDNYQIFDSKLMAPFDVADAVRAELQRGSTR